MLEPRLSVLIVVSLCGCSSVQQPPAATAPATHAVVATTIPVTTVSREAAALFDDAIGLADAGDQAAAALKLDAALELDPNFALAHAARVRSWTREVDAVQLERARSLLQSLPKLERLWAELMTASDSEVPAALAALQAEHSDDWRIRLEIGRQALYWTLDKPLARESFERAVASRPESVGALDALAYLYSEEARWSDALASADRQVALVPSSRQALETLAEVQLMAGKLDAAEQSFRRALELDPTQSSPHEGLASVAFSRNQWAQGIETLRSALDTTADPDRQAWLRQLLIWALVAESRLTEARQLFEQTLSREDPLAELMSSLFDLQVAIELGRWSEAEQIVVSAIEKARAPRAMVRLGSLRPVIEARLGKLTEAEASIAQLDKLLEGQPPHLRKEISVARGELAMAQGRSDDALAAFSDKWVLNHCSLQDPGRTRGRPGFEHYALSAQLRAAEVQLRAGRGEDATARLTALAKLQRRGIGAQAVLRRARQLLAQAPAH